MSYQAISRVDGGAHGDVYRGVDNFGRPVAIKFIRPSVGDVDFAIEQAKALARVKCPHVVEVKTIEEVLDPVSNAKVMAIVMEWIDGHSLEKVLRGPKLTIEKVRTVGTQIIDGMKAIHAAGVAHTDFHFGNVMIGADGAKIIDILYYKTLASTTTSREIKLQSDCNAVRSVLSNLLSHSNMDVSKVDTFNRDLCGESGLEEIQSSFSKATDPTATVELAKLLAHAMQRVADPAFVEGDEYAHALSEETPSVVIVPLILDMIAKGASRGRHKKYLAALYARLNADERAEIAIQLSTQIDLTVPSGTWWPHLFMLSAFGAPGWASLRAATKIRLEKLITDDIIVGRYDIHQPLNRFGKLGTWFRSFHPYFTKPELVLDNLLLAMRAGWNGQNYVAKYFLLSLPGLARSPEDVSRTIERLRAAYENDARELKNNFNQLPENWRNRILASDDKSE